MAALCISLAHSRSPCPAPHPSSRSTNYQIVMIPEQQSAARFRQVESLIPYDLIQLKMFIADKNTGRNTFKKQISVQFLLSLGCLSGVTNSVQVNSFQTYTCVYRAEI